MVCFGQDTQTPLHHSVPGRSRAGQLVPFAGLHPRGARGSPVPPAALRGTNLRSSSPQQCGIDGTSTHLGQTKLKHHGLGTERVFELRFTNWSEHRPDSEVLKDINAIDFLI